MYGIRSSSTATYEIPDRVILKSINSSKGENENSEEKINAKVDREWGEWMGGG